VLLDRLVQAGLTCPDVRVAVEYDGLWHGERRAFLDDRRRLNRLDAAGWSWST
jgi:very-short-patch-repair endonuclease